MTITNIHVIKGEARMRRGTTPLAVLNLPQEIPVANIAVAYFTMTVNGETVLEKELADMTTDSVNNTLTYKFTQAETLPFVAGTLVKYQWRWRVGTADAYATQIYQVPADAILKDGII